MGQILHPSASTTPSTRRKIQNSKKSITQLAKKYGIARNTVWKWKKRNFVHDAPRGIKRRTQELEVSSIQLEQIRLK